MIWDSEGQALSDYLDSITGAVEAGLLDDELWPEQLFKTPADLDGFLAALSDYDDEYRINDRWWFALSRLAQVYEEEGFIRTSDIAGELVVRMTEIEDRKAAAATPMPEKKPASGKTGGKGVAKKKAVVKNSAAKKSAPGAQAKK